MSKFCWAYVGSGNIANQTARQITSGEHKIVAVYSRNEQNAIKFAERYNSFVCNDFSEILNNKQVDAVYIATPHTAHVQYALQAMKAGKAVLCEKPVGVSIKDVNALVECAKENDVYFAEAMWTWFSDVALKVKEWVQNGEIGKIKSVEINYAFPGILMPSDSRVLLAETAGGALLDIGIYPITYCYNLFGEPNKILCNGTIKKGIDYGETVVLEYDGFKCTLKMSLCSLKENAVIKGTDGIITLPFFFHMANSATLKNKNGRQIFKGKTNYLIEFDRAAQEIREGLKESGYIPFSSTIATMKIMDECRRQMKLIYPFEKE